MPVGLAASCRDYDKTHPAGLILPTKYATQINLKLRKAPEEHIYDGSKCYSMLVPALSIAKNVGLRTWLVTFLSLVQEAGRLCLTYCNSDWVA